MHAEYLFHVILLNRLDNPKTFGQPYVLQKDSALIIVSFVGYCARYSIEDQKMINDPRLDCTKFDPPCPIRFQSNESYKCKYMVNLKLFVYYSLIFLLKAMQFKSCIALIREVNILFRPVVLYEYITPSTIAWDIRPSRALQVIPPRKVKPQFFRYLKKICLVYTK